MAVKSTQRIATLYLTHKTQHKGYQFIYRNRERKTQRRSVTHGSKKWSQATANKSLRLVRGHDVAQKWPFFYISFRTLLHIPHTSVHPSATLHSRTNCSMRFSIFTVETKTMHRTAALFPSTKCTQYTEIFCENCIYLDDYVADNVCWMCSTKRIV